MNRLSLRVRVGLFFTAILAGCLILLVSGLLAGYQRAGNHPDGYVMAGAIAGFGMLLLITGIWYLFDEYVAKAVSRIAAELRSRAHADIQHGIDPAVARYLGDLGPAAQAISQRLGTDRESTSERVASETARLGEDRQRLATLLSKIPVAVIMVSDTDRVLLYDGQAADMLSGQRSLCLGRSIYDYLDQESLRALQLAGDGQPLALLSADRNNRFVSVLSQLDDGLGYLITMQTEQQAFLIAPPAAVDSDEAPLAPEQFSEPATAANHRWPGDSLAASTLPTRSLVFDFAVRSLDAAPAHSRDVLLDSLVFVIFDSETTGLDPNRDELVQLGAVRVFDGRVIEGEIFETLINPGRAIPHSSTEVHGIDDSMVQGAPEPAQAAIQFAVFAEDAVLVAHNAPFDMAFLQRATTGEPISFSQPILDTVLLAAELLGTDNELTLDALAERFGIALETDERHTALGDAKATAAVLIQLLAMLKARGATTLGDAITAQQRHSRLLPDLNDA